MLQIAGNKRLKK